MEFTEIREALGLGYEQWSFLCGFFQFKEEPLHRIGHLCVTEESKVGPFLRELVSRGIVRERKEGAEAYYSLAPLEDWLPKGPRKGRDQEAFALEVEILRRILDLRGRPSITIVATREIRRRDLLVPEVMRYSTTYFPTVDLRLGTKCNLNCIYCLLGHEDRFLRPLHEIISDLKFAREQNIEKVSFTGGEPTIHPDIVKIVSAARAMGFRQITLVTNGVFLSYPGRLRRLVEAGVNAVGISFDTPEQKTAEALWQAPVFDRVVRAFEEAARYPNLPLGSIAVVTRLNYKQLEDLARFFVEVGKKASGLFVPNLDFVMPEENAWLNRDLVVPRLEEVVPYVRRALEIAHAEKVPLTFRGFPFCLLEGLERWSFDRYMTIFNLVKTDGGVVHDRFSLDLRRAKREECSGCRYNRECTGVSRSYAHMYGMDELRPVQ